MVVPVGGWGFRILTVVTLTAGTSFLMWLGEQITERGIGNGISLIIFSGIVARFPVASHEHFQTYGHRRVDAVFHGAYCGSHDCGGRCDRFCGERAAKNSRSICQAGRWKKDVWRTDNASSFEGQYGRRYSADFCFFHYHVPCDHREFSGTEKYPWLQSVVGALAPGHIVYTIIYVTFIFFFCYFYTAVHF